MKTKLHNKDIEDIIQNVANIPKTIIRMFEQKSTLPKSNPLGLNKSFDLEKVWLMWGQIQ